MQKVAALLPAAVLAPVRGGRVRILFLHHIFLTFPEKRYVMAKKQPATANESARRPSHPAKKRSTMKNGETKSAGKRAKEAAAAPAGKTGRPGRPAKGIELDQAAPGDHARARVLNSSVVWEGPLFRVLRDQIVEPTGLRSERDIIRHNGSVVILAIDRSRSKKNPWIVMERQYRHAANQFLWEVPAGKLEAGEDPLEGAKRELEEETGYQARKWRPLVTYYASPGFLGEAMLVYLAEDLYAGEARPEEDERIELRLVRLSEILRMIEKGAIHDGKTLNAVLLYAWMRSFKRKK
jgi:ADP-ribose pyrophosphatase